MNKEVKAQTWAREILKKEGYNIFANSRNREIVTYRSLHVVMCRKNLKWSLDKIASFYKDNGKKSYDHSTALHAERMFEQYCFYDSNLIETMEFLSALTDGLTDKFISLEVKLGYIDSEFYDSVSGCLNEALELTRLKNQEHIQDELKRKKTERFYA